MPSRLLLASTATVVGALVVLGALTYADASEGRSATPRASGAVSHTISMRSVSFGPRELAVQVGDTVVWHNVDIVKHNAVRRELFDTGELEPGEKFAWVPSDTGSYRYQCTIHQRMRGWLTVAATP